MDDNNKKSLDEMLIEISMYQQAIDHGRNIKQKNSELEKDARYQLDEFKAKKMDVFIRKTIKHETKKQIGISRSLKKISIIALVIGMTLLATCITPKAFRLRILNSLIRIENEYTEIQLTEEGSDQEYSNNFEPTYIPEGFIKESITQNTDFESILYIKNDETLIFSQYTDKSILNIDTENAEVQKLLIDKMNGMLIQKGEFQTLSWNDTARGKIFALVVNRAFRKEELVRIAESVS